MKVLEPTGTANLKYSLTAMQSYIYLLTEDLFFSFPRVLSVCPAFDNNNNKNHKA